jgi:hypothetical protein
VEINDFNFVIIIVRSVGLLRPGFQKRFPKQINETTIQVLQMNLLLFNRQINIYGI